MPTVDELLAALPEVGLTLWRFDQGEDKRWHVTLEEARDGILAHPFGDGATPIEAFTEALRKAGVQIDD